MIRPTLLPAERDDRLALTNYDRVGRAQDLLKEGLQPFVEREFQAKYGKYWVTTVTANWHDDLMWDGD